LLAKVYCCIQEPSVYRQRYRDMHSEREGTDARLLPTESRMGVGRVEEARGQ